MSKIIDEILSELLEDKTQVKKIYEYILEEIEEVNLVKNDITTKEEALFSNKDMLLISYPDQFQDGKNNPLISLKKFLENDLENKVNGVHILPFYPWTSDDGFSPKSYDEVCDEYGTWDDIDSIKQFKMFDCVFNHISSSSEFFQKALAGNKDYENMFHIFSEEQYNSLRFQEHIRKVVRPRIHPLLTKYTFSNNEDKYVWTTFSEDQIDTNISNHEMLKYIIKSFFKYIQHGSKYFRVDAVPFFWKELGTNCSHQPNTHKFVQLLREITNLINKNLLIVTESNVPHDENITYFGDGSNEAHVIYNFSLAPLVLHSINTENSSDISRWAKKVFNTSDTCSFLNFTATHDGIGLRGLEGIVSDEHIDSLCKRATSKSGVIGKKRGRDGSTRPYEMNITWASFLTNDDEPIDISINKIVNSHAVIMFFPGIPAHYAHNFLGSLNWEKGFKDSSIPRRLNRKKIKYPINYSEYSLKVKNKLLAFIDSKTSNSNFHPNEPIEVLNLDFQVLCFTRGKNKPTLVAFNLTNKIKEISYQEIKYKLSPYELIIS